VLRCFWQFQHIQHFIYKAKEGFLILLYLNPDNLSSIIKPFNALLADIYLDKSIKALIL